MYDFVPLPKDDIRELYKTAFLEGHKQGAKDYAEITKEIATLMAERLVSASQKDAILGFRDGLGGPANNVMVQKREAYRNAL